MTQDRKQDIFDKDENVIPNDDNDDYDDDDDTRPQARYL